MHTPTLTLNPFESTRRPINPGVITEAHTDPAWDAIAAALGESDSDTERAGQREVYCRLITSIMDWICGPADARQGEVTALYGRRAIALRLALNKDAFGKSLSAQKLSRQLGVDPVNLCRLGKQAAAAFGLRPKEKPIGLPTANGHELNTLPKGSAFHIGQQGGAQ